MANYNLTQTGAEVQELLNKVSLFGKFTCSDAADSQVKNIHIDDFTLIDSVAIAVTFVNGNSAASIQLNVNYTGNVPVYYRNSPLGAGLFTANATVILMYNATGNRWDVLSELCGTIYDISAAHPDGQGNPTPYADLTAALGTGGVNIPEDIRKGGMSIKFIQGTVQSYDNKYVQYRLMSDSFNTTPANWQGVDDEPTAGSSNLVESGGVLNSLIKNYVPTSVTIPSSNKGKYISIGNIGSTVDITPITHEGFEYIIIAVKAGDCVSVKGDGAGSPRLWAFTDSSYVLLRKSEDDAHVENPVMLQATTDGYFISNGKTYTGYIEHIVYIYQSLSDVKRDLDEKCEDYFKTNELSAYKARLGTFNEGIKIDLDSDFDNSGYDGGGVWAQIGNKDFLHRMLFVKGGRTIIITTGSSIVTQYALMDLNSKPENDKNITYVDGVTRTTLSYNSNVTITPTKDCYLYLLEKYQSQPYGLPQVSIDGVNPFASLEQKPKGILIYDAQAKKFNFYGHRKDDEYYGFTVELVISNDPIVYKYLWELTVGGLYQYNGQTFTKIADTIDAPENEMAIHFKGKGDYTGGYHGDERIDVSPNSFVKFFADGKELSTATSFVMYCSSFSYIEYSTLHETTNDGTTPIDGHPIVAYHTKRAIFENCSHIVENYIEMVGTQIVDQAHAGLICIDKGAATFAFLPNNVLTPELTGSNDLYNARDKALSIVDMWNPNNNIKVSVSGIFLQGYDDSQDISTFAVWDRAFDSKYYRRTGSDKTFTNGQVISNRQITKFY